MSPPWEALGARARGLSGHLLSEAQERDLGHARSIPELIHALRDTPYARNLGARHGGHDGLERAVSRSLGERFALLTRWAGPGARCLQPVLIWQDARNMRDVVRGTVGGLTREQKLANTIPTPTLGARALEALTRVDSVGRLAATLLAWGHPLGSALLDEASRRHPDLFRMELAIARSAAAEASAAARTCGVHVRSFVREEIDAGNVVAAVLLAGASVEERVAEFFVEGGTRLGVEAFERAASTLDRPASVEVLARAMAGSVFSAPLRVAPAAPAELSERITAARVEELVRARRAEPVSALPVLLFVLRLREEARVVRRAVWSIVLAGGGSA